MKVSILSLKGVKVPAVGYCWHAIHDVQIWTTNILLNRLLQMHLLISLIINVMRNILLLDPNMSQSLAFPDALSSPSCKGVCGS